MQPGNLVLWSLVCRISGEIQCWKQKGCRNSGTTTRFYHRDFVWEPEMQNVSSLLGEVKEWQRYWKSKDSKELLSSPNLMECLIHANEDVFPNICTLLRIGCMLPVWSCEAKRFSCLWWIKTCLRDRMVSQQFSGLALMNMNHDMETDLERVCQMFIDRNKRRMFSSCI